jgi:hypothetical protein
MRKQPKNPVSKAKKLVLSRETLRVLTKGGNAPGAYRNQTSSGTVTL